MVVGTAFGLNRYAYGGTLPRLRAEFGLGEVLLGVIAGGSQAGFLAGLFLAIPLAARFGLRAPTTLGGACGALGALLVCTAQSPLLLAAGVLLAGSSSGLVWAPYNDIVADAAPERVRPRMLAVISTGTAVGLALLGSLLAFAVPWRTVWAVAAVCATVAAVLNLRWVPRTRGRLQLADAETVRRPPREPLFRRAAIAPLAYTVAQFVVVTAYFTYAADAAVSAGAGERASGVIFIVLGVSGVTGFFAGDWCVRWGTPLIGALTLLAVGSACVLLGLMTGSLFGIVASAVLAGVGYNVSGGVMAIWAAETYPSRSGEGFTFVLVVGLLGGMAAPPLIGAFRAVAELPTILIWAGLLGVAAAAALLAGAPRGGRRGANRSDARRV